MNITLTVNKTEEKCVTIYMISHELTNSKSLRTEMRQAPGLQGISNHCTDFQDLDTSYCMSLALTMVEYPTPLPSSLLSVSACDLLILKDLLAFPAAPCSQPAIAEGPRSGFWLNLLLKRPHGKGFASISYSSFLFDEVAVYIGLSQSIAW